MKKFKIQSFVQKSFLKKNILNKLFSKFFTLFNMLKGTWKISFSQFKKKNIENYLSEKFQLNYGLFVLSIVFFLYLLYVSIEGIDDIRLIGIFSIDDLKIAMSLAL